MGNFRLTKIVSGFLFLTMVVFSFPSFADAATYYVSKTATNGYAEGSDSNDGTSTSTPFLTLFRAHAVAVSNQDTVYINDGTYDLADSNASNKYLQITKGITLLPQNANQVTFFATGGGGLVIDAKLGASASLTIGAIKIDAQGFNNSTKGSVELRPQGVGTSLTLTGTSFINQGGGGVTCSYTTNAYNFTATNVSFTATSTPSDAIRLSGIIGGAVSIDGVTLNWVGASDDIGVYIKAGATSPTVSIKNVTGSVSNVNGMAYGIYVRNVPNALVENSNLTVTSGGVGGSAGIKVSAESGYAADGAIIRNNTVTCQDKTGHCLMLGESVASSTYIATVNNGQIYGNTLTHVDIWDQQDTPHGLTMGMGNDYTTGGLVYNNVVSGFNPNFLAAKCGTTTVYRNNISINGWNIPGGLYAKGSSGMKFYNNTVYNNNGYSGRTFSAIIHSNANSPAILTSSNNVVFKNNIAYDLGSSFPRTIDGSLVNGSRFNSVETIGAMAPDYNDYWSVSALDPDLAFVYAGNSYGTFSSWQALGFDTNSVFANPSINTNYTLNSPSPAIDAGTGVGLTTDYTGTNSIYGVPDIGAYEYQPPFTVGTTNIPTTGSIRIYSNGKYRMTTASTSATTADFSVTPTSVAYYSTTTQYMDITLNTWDTTGDRNKKWTATSTAGDFLTLATSTIYTVGDLTPSVYYRFQLDGLASTTAITDNTQCTAGICLADADGQIAFTYVGGYSTHTFELVKDVSSPLVSVTEPSNNTNVSGRVNLTASASDDISLASIQLTIDGINYGSSSASTPYTLNWESTTVADGYHTVNAVALDNSGNYATSSTVTINVVNQPSGGVHGPAFSNPSDNSLPVVSVSSPIVLTRNLPYLVTNNQVKLLQKFLNDHGFLIAKSGPGSKGHETNFFGVLTKKAVIKFQLANKIKPAVGYVGPITRAVINKTK